MTDLEEQKMMEAAQNGDPKAKYELSLWARQIAPLKPDEEKWNRLAAACLVDAAKAGYEPAVQMVQQLMGAETPAKAVEEPTEKAAEEAAEEVAEEVAEEISEEMAEAEENVSEKPAPEGDIFDRLFAGLDEVPVSSATQKPSEDFAVPAEEAVSEPDEFLPGFTLEPDEVEPQVYVPYTDSDFADYEEEEEKPLPPSFMDKAKDLAGKAKTAAAGLVAKAGELVGSLKKKPVSQMEGEDVLLENMSFVGESPKSDAPETKSEAAPEALSEEIPRSRSANRTRASEKGWMNRVLDWVGDNWRIVRIALIAVIVVLAILVILLLLPKGTFQKEPEPTPTPIPTATPEPTPTPEPFPNEATRNEIAATAVLDYRPEEGEFLTASASYTVNSEDGMNMRSGPSTDYDVLARLSNEQMVTAYARHTTEEDTWYLVNTGGNWGWVISDYLQ